MYHWEVKHINIIDKSFIKAPKHYIIQSLLAVLALAIILYFVEVLTHAAIIAALGSSVFIVFTMPHSTMARSRRLVGGHIVGLLTGTFCYFLFLTGAIGSLVDRWEFTTIFVYALAVGLSIFLMVITDTEHAPAAGTALGIVASPWSFQVTIFVLLSAVALAIIGKLLRGYLKELL